MLNWNLRIDRKGIPPMIDESTKELDAKDLRELQLGGEKALARVLERHRNQLARMIEFRLDRRLLTRLDVDDVLQEAYLVQARRLDDYLQNPAVPVFVWLRTMTQQVIVDMQRRHLRAKKRDARLDVPLNRRAGAGSASVSIAARLAASLTSPSKAAVRADMRAHLQAALDEMEPIDGEVLALRHFEELSNNEVALILGLSAAAASNRYTRALKRLGQIMKEAKLYEEETIGR